MGYAPVSSLTLEVRVSWTRPRNSHRPTAWLTVAAISRSARRVDHRWLCRPGQRPLDLADPTDEPAALRAVAAACLRAAANLDGADTPGGAPGAPGGATGASRATAEPGDTPDVLSA